MVVIAGFLVLGVLIGSVAGLLGIGGGMMLVPLFIFVLKMDVHTAVGTSLAVIAPVALFSAISHGYRGHVHLAPVLILAIGAILGGILSGQIAPYLPAPILRKAFAFFSLLVALKLFMK